MDIIAHQVTIDFICGIFSLTLLFFVSLYFILNKNNLAMNKLLVVVLLYPELMILHFIITCIFNHGVFFI